MTMNRAEDWFTDDRLQDLLAEWVERRDAGEDVAASVLCADDPHLAAQLESAIEELKQTDWILNSTDASQIDDPGSAIEEQRWADLAETLTAEQLLDRVESIGLLPRPVLDEVRDELSTEDGSHAARDLVSRGVTPFQLLIARGERDAYFTSNLGFAPQAIAYRASGTKARNFRTYASRY